MVRARPLKADYLAKYSPENSGYGENGKLVFPDHWASMHCMLQEDRGREEESICHALVSRSYGRVLFFPSPQNWFLGHEEVHWGDGTSRFHVNSLHFQCSVWQSRFLCQDMVPFWNWSIMPNVIESSAERGLRLAVTRSIEPKMMKAMNRVPRKVWQRESIPSNPQPPLENPFRAKTYRNRAHQEIDLEDVRLDCCHFYSVSSRHPLVVSGMTHIFVSQDLPMKWRANANLG